MVVVFMIVAAMLAFLAGNVIVTDTQMTGFVHSQGAKSQELFQANNLVELIRAEMRQVMRETGFSLADIRQHLQCDLEGCVGMVVHPRIRALTRLHAPLGQIDEGQYRITRVSAADDDSQFIEIELRPGSAEGRPTTSVRLTLGQIGIFANAWTTSLAAQTVRHAVIYGDVAQYGDVAPENPLQTRVYGTWWATGKDIAKRGFPKLTAGVAAAPYFPIVSPLPSPGADVSMVDALSNFYLNPLRERLALPNPVPPKACQGVQRDTLSWVEAKGWAFEHAGRRLPLNLVRRTLELSKFDPLVNQSLAFGQIDVAQGGMRVLVHAQGGGAGLQTWTQFPPDPSSTFTSRTVRAMMLHGTARNPIRISGRVFVPGDVMISGVIAGQGEILSNRNIYIVDDLVYQHPPQLFDGSASSNARLANLSDPVASLALAHEMEAEGDPDRVALFAAGSIVIGSPFPDPVPAASLPVMADERAVALDWLGSAMDRAAIERKTGYVLQRHAGAAGGCYGRLWDPYEDCLPVSDSAFSGQVWLTPGADPANTSLGNRDYYLANGLWKLPPQFEEQLLPRYVDPNVRTLRAGANPLIPWLDRDSMLGTPASCAFAAGQVGMLECGRVFDAASDGDHEIARAEAMMGPTDPRRGRTKHLSLPVVSAAYPASTNPYDPNDWNPTRLRHDLAASVFGTSLQGVRVRCQGSGCPASGDVPLEDKIEGFFRLCRDVARGARAADAPDRMPDIGLGHRDRISFLNAQNWLPLQWNSERPVPWGRAGSPWAAYDANVGSGDADRRYNGIRCELSYYQADRVALMKVDLESTTPGAPCEEVVRTNACSDYQAKDENNFSLSDDFGARDAYRAAAPGVAPPVFKCSQDLPESVGTPAVPVPWRPDRPDVRGSADLSIVLAYAGGPAVRAVGGGPVISLGTRYWDAAKLPARNIVRRIQSFLFANDVIAVFGDTLADRELRIYGGVIARQVAGRLINRLGHERDYTGVATATPPGPGGGPAGAPSPVARIPDLATLDAINAPGPYIHASAGLADANEAGALHPGLVLVKDPRFELRTGLIDRSFLRYDFRY